MFLKDLTLLSGVSGCEFEVRNYIKAKLEEIGCEYKIDKLGNVIAHNVGKKNDKKIMLAAHMDEVGLMVSSIDDGGFIKFQTVGGIAITLAGAYGLVFLITKIFKKPLMKLGHLLGMNDIAAAGLIASLANNIAMFQTVKDMDKRGKVINIAFAVSASFTFGDHLGFTAGVAPELITPMIIGKLVGGISAIFVAIFLSKRVFRIE